MLTLLSIAIGWGQKIIVHMNNKDRAYLTTIRETPVNITYDPRTLINQSGFSTGQKSIRFQNDQFKFELVNS